MDASRRLAISRAWCSEENSRQSRRHSTENWSEVMYRCITSPRLSLPFCNQRPSVIIQPSDMITVSFMFRLYLWQWVEVWHGHVHFGQSIAVNGHCSLQDLVCALALVLQKLPWVLLKTTRGDTRHGQPPLLLLPLKGLSERGWTVRICCLDTMISVPEFLVAETIQYFLETESWKMKRKTQG